MICGIEKLTPILLVQIASFFPSPCHSIISVVRDAENISGILTMASKTLLFFTFVFSAILFANAFPSEKRSPQYSDVNYGQNPGNIIEPPRYAGGRGNGNAWVPPPNGRPVDGRIIEPPRRAYGGGGGNIIEPPRRPGAVDSRPPRYDYENPDGEQVWVPPPNGVPVQRPIIQPPRRPDAGGSGNIIQPPRFQHGNSGGEQIWTIPPNGYVPGRPGSIIEPPRSVGGGYY